MVTMIRPFNVSMRRKLRYTPLPFIYGPQAMNILQPLLRASSVAEITLQHQIAGQFSQTRSFTSYNFQFPRPRGNSLARKRNLRLPNFKLTKRSFSLANQKLRSKTKNIHKRFFSAEARRQRRERRRFVRWWTLTLLTLVLGGVAAKIRYERQEEENKYSIKPQSWHLYAYSTLPLKAISRLWGQVNSINLPVWMRSPLFRLYSMIFGVNLGEMDEPDLTTYPNLSEFFYRKLKPGVRPVADGDLVSPSDGKILKFGVITNGEIEQVKGMTYSVDALLGLDTKRLAAPRHSLEFDLEEHAVLKRDEEFAKINGISYSVDDIIGGESDSTYHINELDYKDKGDKAVDELSLAHDVSMVQSMTPTPLERFRLSGHKQLYFAVIYLAPGDYHRFHSPTNWVTTLRRHFIGELFSVAPFFQKTLQGLFVLNERVALLGYWKHGFFSMTPVGATNVGSIIVNFDKDLKTNVIYEHESYSRSSLVVSEPTEETPLLPTSQKDVQPKRLKKNTVYEATYTNASRLLGGYPLSKGEEIGGFKLGLTVVLAFEAPDNFKFDLELGQKIKMGQALGHFE